MSTSRSGRPCSGPDRFNGPEGSKSIIASPRLPTGVRYKIVLEAFKEEFLFGSGLGVRQRGVRYSAWVRILKFAINYRQLNNITKKDAYSLLNIQSILDKLRGSRYFSFLDVASAYWSVPAKKIDIAKTAFHTPRGQYERVVMPFGLCNSQITFQRLIDNILEGVARAEAYVEDCCVFSRTFEEHFEDLGDTITRIREGSVKLRRDKCHFGYSGGEFLGHHISSERRSPHRELRGS